MEVLNDSTKFGVRGTYSILENELNMKAMPIPLLGKLIIKCCANAEQALMEP